MRPKPLRLAFKNQIVCERPKLTVAGVWNQMVAGTGSQTLFESLRAAW